MDDDAAYQALLTRDPRFDGRLFVGVTSTGIYCRPVCRVRTPKRANCRFFPDAWRAEQAGFRPCLRCRPEVAPGWSVVDAPGTLAHQAAREIDAAVAEGRLLPQSALAARLGVSDRHLRRIFQDTHGVTPLAYLSTQRLLMAKRLLTDTALPVTDIAQRVGFGSLRRFNATFVEHYRLTPSAVRASGDRSSTSTDGLAAIVDEDKGPTLRLAYRPPYDHAAMLAFLRRREVRGLEHVTATGLRRSLRCRDADGRWHAGGLAVDFDLTRHEVVVQLGPTLTPVLGAVLTSVRQALDLDADPAMIATGLQPLPVVQREGLRVPGAFDGFEAAVRVVLGQQVTVQAARTLTGRLVDALGTPCESPWPEVQRCFPSPKALAEADPATLGRLGIVRQRVGALQALAVALLDGRIALHRHAPLEATMSALCALPGIGPWSAQLIAMRCLSWPDAFAPSDIGVLQALGHRDARRAEADSQAWRPWRAYALMNLWMSLE